MEAPANHNTFWPQSLSVSVTTTLGEMETTDTDGVVLYHPCINKHTTPATALILKTLWADQTMHKGDFRTSRRWLKPVLFWNRLLGAYKNKRNKYRPAMVFVALNIPPVRSDFPNLAMRAILEWTPGRAWRQSGKRALHFSDFKPLWKKWKYTEICFPWGPCEANILTPKETIFSKYIQSLSVNAHGTIQIAVFSAESRAHRIKCLTSLVRVLPLLFSRLINFKVDQPSRLIQERPWSVHKTWELPKRRWSWIISKSNVRECWKSNALQMYQIHKK